MSGLISKHSQIKWVLLWETDVTSSISQLGVLTPSGNISSCSIVGFMISLFYSQIASWFGIKLLLLWIQPPFANFKPRLLPEVPFEKYRTACREISACVTNNNASGSGQSVSVFLCIQLWVKLNFQQRSLLAIYNSSPSMSRERRSRSPSSHRVFMGRLPRDARIRDLENFFKDNGFSKSVKDINLKTGFAFIVSCLIRYWHSCPSL